MSAESGSKKTLRAKMQSLLNDTPQDVILSASESICRNLANSMKLFGNPQTIGIYSACDREVPLSSLHRLLKDKRLVYPKCLANEQLSFHHVQDPSELRIGKFGIHEPDPDRHKEYTLDKIDLMLCPGLAFSMDGNRLGRGGGYYDRVLENFPGVKCAITLGSQLTERLPHEPHDVIMDYLASEAGILATRPCSG